MLGQDGSQYFHTAYQTLQYPDIIQGLVKPIVFGFIIASVGCYLRHDHARRHPGSWPIHHAGSSRFVGADHCD